MSGDGVQVAWAARTDVGRRREQNEDACFGEERTGSPPGGLFVVCDGMGGHARGEEASALAVQVLRQELGWAVTGDWPDDSTLLRRVREALLAANTSIFEWNERATRSARERGGTTAVVLLVAGARVCLAHVGDSRIYRLTRGGLDRLTTDHNVASREIASGETVAAAWRRADARHLTQALGPRSSDRVNPDLRVLALDEDALFVLCSDGLSDQDFLDRRGLEVLRPLLHRDADLVAGCGALVDAGNAVNGHDNLPALLVRISGPAGPAARTRVPTTERIPAPPVAPGS